MYPTLEKVKEIAASGRDYARADPGGDARPHRGPDGDTRRNANACPDSSPYGSPDSGSDASTHPGARPDGGLAG